jgi:hypothetical protein
MRNNLNYYFLLAAIMFSGVLSGQDGHIVGYKIEQGDTVYQIRLPSLYVFPRLTFKNEKAKREYQKLVYNFNRVYPYALLAKERVREMDSAIVKIKSESLRKAYIKQKEKELFKEFEVPLKKLTLSQGRLLMRLVDREIGQTSYYLIKDLKGSFTAFFWQGIARLFGANLKTPYDKYGEDKLVEELVNMYHNGTFLSYYNQLFYN